MFTLNWNLHKGGAPPFEPPRLQRGALSHEVQDALNQTDKAGAYDAAKLCLRFIALTAVRSNEARAAQWDEIDLENRT